MGSRGHVLTAPNPDWETGGRPRAPWLLKPLAAIGALAVVALVAVSSSPPNMLAVDGDPPGEPVPTPDGQQEDRGAAEPAADDVGAWRTMAPSRLEQRDGAASAWTGRRLLVWSGQRYGDHTWLGDGAAYDPGQDRWAPLPTAPMAPRSDAATAWSGRDLFIWGGEGAGVAPGGRPVTVAFDDGATYNPRTRRWRRLPPAPLTARADAKAIWNGKVFLVWGGRANDGADHRREGATYDPATRTWKLLPPVPHLDKHLTNVSLPRVGDDVLLWVTTVNGHQNALYVGGDRVWVQLDAPALFPGVLPPIAEVLGSAIVWGRRVDGRPMASRLAPGDRLWTAVAPPPRAPIHDDQLVGAGSRALAWQGSAGGLMFETATNRWTTRDQTPLRALAKPTLAWTGQELLVWHGASQPGAARRAGAWTPGNPWRELRPPGPIPAGASALWTGWRRDEQQLLIWGGSPHDPRDRAADDVWRADGPADGPAPDGNAAGLAYDAEFQLWEHLPPAPITPRHDHAAAWTGEEMIVAGGSQPGAQSTAADPADALLSAAAWNPATREWRRLPRVPIAVRRDGATWTGRDLIAVGLPPGAAAESTKLRAAAYRPNSDRWVRIARPPLPRGVLEVTTVWSGFEVWVLGFLPGGRVAAAAWDPRFERWRPLPGTGGLQSPAAATWALNRVYVVGVDGRTRSLGRGGTAWRPSPRSPFRGAAMKLAWTGHAVFAIDAVAGQVATLGMRATSWASFAAAPVPLGRDVELVATGRDVFAVGGGRIGVLPGGR